MSAFETTVIGGIARVAFNLPGEPVNKITAAVRSELEQVISMLRSSGDVRAAVLISGKPDTFIAGADIEEFVALQTRAQAEALVRAGQALINRLEGTGKPVVAAIHGACLGGGFEAALACTYRVATDHSKTVIGLPEVQLGIIPAAGGCQRLPRLIGARAALDIILAGKTVPASRAFRLGMVDELVHPAILESVAMGAARRLADGWKPKRRGRGIAGALLDGNSVGRAVVFSAARKQLRARTHGHYPAPPAALDAVEVGLRYGIREGLDREARSFGELAVGEVSRNLVQIFFATTALKKDPGIEGPAPEPASVSRVVVVGAGFMGAAIGAVAVTQARADVRLKDTDLNRVARGLDAARRVVRDRLTRRRITRFEHERLQALLSGGVDWSGFGGANLVIEAVFEDLAVKQQVFREIESHTSPKCILASNTSTIPIGRIAEALARPERVLGMHFFSPVDRMPLLEVIVTGRTDPAVVVTAVAFGRRMGKTVVVVSDRPGFWVNRILGPYLNEAGRLVAEGVAVETVDRVAVNFGFPVGPIALMDEIGLDVIQHAAGVMHDAFGERLAPLAGIQRLVQEKRLGRKSGRGFYVYQGGKKRGPDPIAVALLGATGDAKLSETEVERRLVLPLLNEAAMALDEGVVRSPRDGDVAAVFGFGFPPFRGGPLRYADRLTARRLVQDLQALQSEQGERFAPAERLRRMAASGEAFYSRP
ncbi:MAG: enoyl-CoA hydratase/isomerase family protein [Gemmatimonadetes bacterium]|nr:enoyl-CoA hydratase/isomerase family protein [Gemmatimonadota bacterium]